jgi:hypothetical protein
MLLGTMLVDAADAAHDARKIVLDSVTLVA